MAKTLVIVESPAKAKTIKKYLGTGYAVKASVGHVKDLPKSKMGIDVEHDFKPEYHVTPSKEKALGELKKAAAGAEQVFLATDPDREGEAIAWHLNEELRHPNAVRVLFNEITKKAIQEAIAHPLALDQKMYDSQQTRRILDRLVGYQISPLLWSKVARNLSAGRVQFIAEGFADRGYRPDGSLVPRSQPDAFVEDPEEAVRQAEWLLRDKGVRTLCVHGDNPQALAFVRTLREELARRGIDVRPFE